jgi:hypothetical protein
MRAVSPQAVPASPALNSPAKSVVRNPDLETTPRSPVGTPVRQQVSTVPTPVSVPPPAFSEETVEEAQTQPYRRSTRERKPPARFIDRNSPVKQRQDPANKVYDVELRDMTNTETGVKYLTHWKGFPTSDDSWVSASNISQEAIDAYHEKLNMAKAADPAEDAPSLDDESDYLMAAFRGGECKKG